MEGRRVGMCLGDRRCASVELRRSAGAARFRFERMADVECDALVSCLRIRPGSRLNAIDEYVNRSFMSAKLRIS